MLPVDMAAARVVVSGLQQRIDEIDAGLDRHHDARLEHPREPQVRMAFGPRALCAFRVAHHAADVVHLEPQQMADAVRKEHPRNPGLERRLALQRGQSDLLEHVPHEAMRGEVHLPVVAPRHDLVAHAQLRAIERRNQVGERSGGGGIGARDVRRVAPELRAGVDEEGAQRVGWAALEMLIMQHRRILVIGDDIVVRHLLLALLAGLEVAHLGLVFGRAVKKGRQCRAMPTRTQRIRAAHAFELVGRLHGAVVVQLLEQIGVVEAVRRRAGKRLARTDECDAAEAGPVRRCAGWDRPWE